MPGRVSSAAVAERARPRPLTVLMLSDVFFPRVNGVSTSIATLRRALPGHGVDPLLVAPAYGGEPVEPGLVRVAGRRVPFDPEDRFVAPRRLERAASPLAFDLVHVQTPFAAHRAGVRLARSRGVPVVETWHTDFEHYLEHYLPLVPARLARGLARSLSRRIGREVDRLVVPSSAIDARLGGHGVTVDRVVIPTGVGLEELGPGDGERFRTAHGIARRRPVAVHVGRIAHEKSPLFLLDVAEAVRREISDFLLVVAGEGPALADLRRRAAELRLEPNLLFVGYLDRRRDLADAYRAGDCFVFASRTETQGLVLLEAMALGVPVVALAEQGTRDLLGRGRGALVPRAEVGPFASAVARLLRDDGLRTRLGREAAELAREWAPGPLAGRLADLYRSVVTDAVRRGIGRWPAQARRR